MKFPRFSWMRLLVPLLSHAIPLTIASQQVHSSVDFSAWEALSHRKLSAGAGESSSILALVFGECLCTGALDCNTEVDGSSVIPPALDLLISFIIMLYMFKLLGSMCDEYFVQSLSSISEALNLSPDVAGATFMAAGSSAPELFTSVMATFLIVNEGGVGTIIGSAIFNILVIVGATCLFAGQALKICWYPLARDTTFYVIAIVMMTLFLLDEEIVLWESLLMIIGYVGYCTYMKYNDWIAAKLGVERSTPVLDFHDSVPLPVLPVDGGTGGLSDGPRSAPSSRKSSLEAPVGHMMRRASTHFGELKFRAKVHTETTLIQEASVEDKEGEEEPRLYDPILVLWRRTMPSDDHYWLLFTASVLWIGLLTYLMVDACNRIGCLLNLPVLVMGLIFLAAGTSVPDALGSIAVARHGEGDMAVSNAIGSNVFDIMLGLGVPWTLKLAMGKEVLFPTANEELPRYIIILVIVLALFLFSVTVAKCVLNRLMGVCLLGLYCCYIVYALVMAAT
ncbi:hypothetical protein FOL47_008785 [Perkinsus chesapeaki]|uniref:Sodium/calcium exchanger membrane region domain-containing protein n=1 Tax=Perkinsus chesapeaki TaxID=330153 RepID=A0A7J6MT07_PERCH|nr:hypothetical protein FOL47_008785 [Perkinsus chesapeaki]